MSTGPVDTEFLPSEVEGRLSIAEVRSDVAVAVRMLVVLAVAGLPLGALWTLVTPVEQVVLLSTGSTGTPTGEGDHAFDAIAVVDVADLVHSTHSMSDGDGRQRSPPVDPLGGRAHDRIIEAAGTVAVDGRVAIRMPTHQVVEPWHVDDRGRLVSRLR